MTIEDDLKVDLLDLATDAAAQPTLYHNWAIKYAEAHSKKVRIREKIRVDKIRIKQEFDDRRSGLEVTVRDNWADYSTERISDAKITATVTTLADFKEAQEAYLAALEELNQEIAEATREDLIMEAARDAMQQRQESIRTAAKLYLGGYFSETPINPILKEAKEAQNKDTQQKIKVALKKRM